MHGCVVPTRYADPGPSRSPRERGAAPDLSGVGLRKHTEPDMSCSSLSFLAPASFQICVLAGGGRMAEDRDACGAEILGGSCQWGCAFSALGVRPSSCGGSSCLWLAVPTAVGQLPPRCVLELPQGQRVTFGADGFGRAAGMALTSLPPSLPPGRTPRPSRRSS